MKTSISLSPTIIVIFGGTGDLNLRKLAPALYNLYSEGYMPEKYAIIGTARRPLDDEKFRNTLMEGVNSFSRTGKVHKDKWDNFSKNIYYKPSDVKDSASFDELRVVIEKFKDEFGPETQIV